jgi:hypothetical protein
MSNRPATRKPVYHFMGPPAIATTIRDVDVRVIRSAQDLLLLLEQPEYQRERTSTFTFVVDLDGLLHLADRCAEHFDCAFGLPVLSAGEITFRQRQGTIHVVAVTNQSTGYCPSASSWPFVQAALATLRIPHPDFWTAAFTLRRCENCYSSNIVKDQLFQCAVCGTDLSP